MCANYLKSQPGDMLCLGHSNTTRVHPMERADLFRVYELGDSVHPLGTVRDGITLEGLFGPMVNARSALMQLVGNDPQVRVELCQAAAKEVLDVIDYVQRGNYWDDKANTFKWPDNPQSPVQNWYLWQLRNAIQNFEAVFRAEMQAASTYWVPKRGAYSTRDLVDAFDRTFLPELHETLGDLALSEYRNAGRCFAFGLWTAAGYHACRAVEAVLRGYYDEMCAKELTEGKTWGTLIDDLTAEAEDPKPNEKTLFYLRQLKDSERNPLMHVRVVLDEQDADLLLNSAKIVMTLMAREIIAEKKRMKELCAEPSLRAIEGNKVS
jgi:hypothetical protein